MLVKSPVGVSGTPDCSFNSRRGVSKVLTLSFSVVLGVRFPNNRIGDGVSVDICGGTVV